MAEKDNQGKADDSSGQSDGGANRQGIERLHAQVLDAITYEHLTPRQAAERFRMTQEAIHEICRTYRRERLIKPVHRRILDALTRLHMTLEEAAAALGVAPKTVKHVCNKYRIRPRTGARPRRPGRPAATRAARGAGKPRRRKYQRKTPRIKPHHQLILDALTAEDLTVKETAAKVGMGEGVVRYVCSRYHIKARRGYGAPEDRLRYKRILNALKSEDLTVDETATKFNVTTAMVRYVCNRYGFRPRKGYHSRIPELADAEWLRRRIVVERRTLQQVADMVGCSRQRVHQQLLQFGIRPPKRHRGGRHKRRRRIALKGLLSERRVRAWHDGRQYTARVMRSGAIKLLPDGKVYDNPDKAARAVCKEPTDGWSFWCYKAAPGTWVPIAELRNRMPDEQDGAPQRGLSRRAGTTGFRIVDFQLH